MAVVAFLVLFAGVISSTIAAAGRAALLTFILPVMLPGTVGDIPNRLFGWAIACAMAIPAALFLWPPQEHNQLRVRASEMCAALGRMLELSPDLSTGRSARRSFDRAEEHACRVPGHHVPPGRPEHRQPAAGSPRRRAGVAVHGGDQRLRRRPGIVAPGGPTAARRLRRGAAFLCAGTRTHAAIARPWTSAPSSTGASSNSTTPGSRSPERPSTSFGPPPRVAPPQGSARWSRTSVTWRPASSIGRFTPLTSLVTSSRSRRARSG